MDSICMPSVFNRNLCQNKIVNPKYVGYRTHKLSKFLRTLRKFVEFGKYLWVNRVDYGAIHKNV